MEKQRRLKICVNRQKQRLKKKLAQAAYDSAIQELESLKNQAEENLQAQEAARTQAYNNPYESAKEQDAAASGMTEKQLRQAITVYSLPR